MPVTSFTAYHFLDEDFDNLYKSEKRMSKIFSYFAILAIFISCLGLFGLSLFTAEQKTKEIGIRKAMGASLSSLVMAIPRVNTCDGLQLLL